MLGQGAQNYIFMKKINIIWGINLILFVAVVFLGIEQAGKGAEISNLESQLEASNEQKRELSEVIFNSGNNTVAEVSDLGFIKPTQVYYFNSIDSVASLK